MIADILGVSFDDHVEIVGDRLGKDSAYLLDASKAREDLAWADRISLEDGIREVIAWVKDNLKIIQSMPRKYVHKP
jgi:dTDP-glucose 4,6-dehydratase